MERESGGQFRFSLRGSAGLIVAVAVVTILLIALPAYRWFFLSSVEWLSRADSRFGTGCGLSKKRKSTINVRWVL
jgi:hypothetical protein